MIKNTQLQFGLWVIGWFLSSSVSADVSAILSKDCLVFSKPNFSSNKQCRMQKGESVRASKGKGVFAAIQNDACSGYIPLQCLAKAGSQTRGVAAESNISGHRPLYLGFVTGFDGLWGKVPYSSTLSKGLGLSIGPELNWGFYSNWHLLARPSYKFLRLGRPVDGSGSLTDPNPVNFDQTLHCVGLGLMAGYLVEGRDTGGYRPGEPQWWVDAGFEFVYPFSSKQTAQGMGDLSIDSDKLLFLVLGPSIDFEISRQWMLSGALELFYNLFSKEQGRLFGVRAKVALDFNL